MVGARCSVDVTFTQECRCATVEKAAYDVPRKKHSSHYRSKSINRSQNPLLIVKLDGLFLLLSSFCVSVLFDGVREGIGQALFVIAVV